uniref:Large ribosomal subunit protein uL11 C-terminal domain-containing protein n=1 Tax=Mustela putorius furo TaxID=9669 RepID=M3YAY4_MUSPF
TPPKFDPNKIRVLLRLVVGKLVPPLPWPQDGPSGSISKKAWGDDTTKTTSDWGMRIPVKLTVQNRVVPSASPMIFKALKESKRQTQKNIKDSVAIIFDEIVNIAQQMQHQPFTREFSGTIKEMLGIVQSVSCSFDGHHLHDIIDGISSGTIGCLTT